MKTKVVDIFAQAVTFSGLVETVEETVKLEPGETAVDKVREIVGEKAWIGNIIISNPVADLTPAN